MLHLVTGALALTVGMKPMPTSTRAPAALMASDMGCTPMGLFGKAMPASCSMAGATPIVVGPDGKGKYAGGDNAIGANPVRTGSSSQFLASGESLGKSLGFVQTSAPASGSTMAPMDFN